MIAPAPHAVNVFQRGSTGIFDPFYLSYSTGMTPLTDITGTVRGLTSFRFLYDARFIYLSQES